MCPCEAVCAVAMSVSHVCFPNPTGLDVTLQTGPRQRASAGQVHLNLNLRGQLERRSAGGCKKTVNGQKYNVENLTRTRTGWLE